MKLIVNFNPQKAYVKYDPSKVDFTIKNPIVKEYIDVEPYRGEYEVMPSRNPTVLETENKRMLHDVVVNPIPSNYGLITWDGSVLTVS